MRIQYIIILMILNTKRFNSLLSNLCKSVNNNIKNLKNIICL